MDVEWVIQDKVVDGRTVTPAETAGQRGRDPKDPESIALLEKHREEMRRYWPLPGPIPTLAPAPGGLWFVLDVLLGGAGRRRQEYKERLAAWLDYNAKSERYHLPLAQVLPDFAAVDPPYVVQEAAPDRRDALSKYAGSRSCYDFDASVLDDEHNAVTAHAAFEMKLQYSSELGLDRSPKEMLSLANDISWSLAHYLKSEPDKDQDSIDIARAVIPWLRFWGRAGHGFVSQY